MIESVEIVVRQPGQEDRVVRIHEGATRIGRAEDNEIVLSDVGVSRRHAQIYVGRGEVTVEDLGSGNGTWCNGYKVESQVVHDGDEIVIDPFTLLFRVRGHARSGSPIASSRNPAPATTSSRAVGARTGGGLRESATGAPGRSRPRTRNNNVNGSMTTSSPSCTTCDSTL